mmetsp:Transcript_132616/g.241317  ORF Transcript_132616/g.241317 Transcript_132616/m.241317 type:complete len:93 (+) Transcript_132616:1444-1722(+)
MNTREALDMSPQIFALQFAAKLAYKPVMLKACNVPPFWENPEKRPWGLRRATKHRIHRGQLQTAAVQAACSKICAVAAAAKLGTSETASGYV